MDNRKGRQWQIICPSQNEKIEIQKKLKLYSIEHNQTIFDTIKQAMEQLSKGKN